MNIGIDIDDTISETFEILLPYAQKYTIEELKRKSELKTDADCTTHFYIEYINGWNDEQALDFWTKYYGEILKNVNIKFFASETIKKLKQQGHKIYLITARWDMPNDNIKQITRDWLDEKQVEYDELITNASDKLTVVKEKCIDLFVDDSFQNCKTIVHNSNIKVYMMSSRVNERYNDDKIKRVFSWPEIYDLINREEN